MNDYMFVLGVMSLLVVVLWIDDKMNSRKKH